MFLNELIPSKGKCTVKGEIAYASQEPWIFSGTVRQNILCGLDLDEVRYFQVIKASALEFDLSKFPHGDETQVGEKGISLSGGQKSRISLARCLYVKADIYLLDDPLSAVDAHVGRQIFNNAINGFLRGKIRVLVTHQLHYLKNVDRILILEQVCIKSQSWNNIKSIYCYSIIKLKGSVRGLGTYKDLEDQGLLDCIGKKDEREISLTICQDLNIGDKSLEFSSACSKDETVIVKITYSFFKVQICKM